ncbi:hypothetical protein GCM10010387_24930 [Streptomyces inusitatus]|uniref:Gram-positive cocci surface proteins LPxTG domain-containing protein n=1 Tax=Streptomyces inusitatus TaxID=68221 RepID=A0A918Q140_9ACTN|nr:hypothetical protein [Streptomyces inusitatus]GGZ30375.1 hypothetical protein GCM10010387_24930 [Streptomyces inusitatus]
MCAVRAGRVVSLTLAGVAALALGAPAALADEEVPGGAAPSVAGEEVPGGAAPLGGDEEEVSRLDTPFGAPDGGGPDGGGPGGGGHEDGGQQSGTGPHTPADPAERIGPEKPGGGVRAGTGGSPAGPDAGTLAAGSALVAGAVGGGALLAYRRRSGARG